MDKRQENESQYMQQTKATRYTAIAFAIVALALLVVSAYSYLTASKVQENYNKMALESLYRLELINKLHHNEDLIYNAALKHVQATDTLTKARLEQKIRQTNDSINSDLSKLQTLIYLPKRRDLVQKYSNTRQEYTDLINQLIILSSQRQSNQAILLEDQQLTPAYKLHQAYLNKLGDTISLNTRVRGTAALKTIDKTIKTYNMLLLAAILVTFLAAYLIRKTVKQMKHHRLMLFSEMKERQQLKDAYSESQLIYRSLFRNISIPMWIFDQQILKVIDVNDAALNEYGYTRDEFLKLSILDLQPQEQKTELQNLISNLKGSLSSYPNWMHKRKDGSVFFVDIKSHGLPKQGNTTPRIVVAINIDDRIKAIQELERREHQLLEISSSIPGVVFQFQLDAEMNYSFPFVSKGSYDLFDISPEEAQTDNNALFSTVHPDDIKYLWDSIAESYQKMIPWQAEFRAWKKPQNKYIWLRGHSLPTRKGNGVMTWNGTLIDITSQKEAQEMLITSEANMRYLLNTSPQAIYLLDSQLNINAFNTRAAEEVNSLQLKTLHIGESILSFVSPNQVNKTIECHKNALQGITTVYETNNAGLWHEVAYRPVLGADRQVLAVALSIEDITEQKLTLETIKHSEMQLARAQELSHVGSWEYDILIDKISWSDNLYKIYGVTPETFIPTPVSVYQLVHPDDKELVKDIYAQARITGEPVNLEHRVIAPSGEVKQVIQIGEVFFDEQNRPIRMSGTIQDITERKRVEQEITETKNLLQSILENIPEIIFSMDADLTLTYVSPQCFELSGYTPEELVGDGTKWQDVVYPEDRPKVEEAFKKVLGGEKVHYEFRLITSDNKLKWFSVRLSCTLNADAQVIRLNGAAADINQYKIAEAKREELHRQVLNQNQNLQQFAYIVSHNLRAPIANILGLTSIYDKTNPNAPINQRVVDNMFKSARLLDSTIRDLNELLTMRSELQDVKESVAFADVLQHITASLSDELKNTDATIESDFSEAPVVVTLRSYLQSIIHNLVSNAIKYRDGSRKLNINLKSFVADEYICLQVSDNGLGIDIKKEKDKIFGLYKRFHPGIAGKGLGLHLVKTQAELLGGKVDVDSSVGVGTTFSVYFLKSGIQNEHIKESSHN